MAEYPPSCLCISTTIMKDTDDTHSPLNHYSCSSIQFNFVSNMNQLQCSLKRIHKSVTSLVKTIKELCLQQNSWLLFICSVQQDLVFTLHLLPIRFLVHRYKFSFGIPKQLPNAFSGIHILLCPSAYSSPISSQVLKLALLEFILSLFYPFEKVGNFMLFLTPWAKSLHCQSLGFFYCN